MGCFWLSVLIPCRVDSGQRSRNFPQPVIQCQGQSWRLTAVGSRGQAFTPLLGDGEREQTLSRSEVRAGRALGKYIQSCPSFGKQVFPSPELSSAGACIPLVGRGLAASEHEGQVVLESQASDRRVEP